MNSILMIHRLVVLGLLSSFLPPSKKNYYTLNPHHSVFNNIIFGKKMNIYIKSMRVNTALYS